MRYERKIAKGSVAGLESADARFRDLVGPAAWALLPAPVQRRFGFKRAGGTIVYAGEIVECRRNAVGRLVVELARLIGAPLPLTPDAGVAAIVGVMEDGKGGQFWTRSYLRRRGFPQVIHSRKVFVGSTGLEEWLGRGFGVALDVGASPEGLVFRSRFYFLRLGARRWRLPSWSCPGELVVGHIDRGDESFAFTLCLRHRWFGEIFSQTGLFRECRVEGDIA
jgi:hypothetical protein